MRASRGRGSGGLFRYGLAAQEPGDLGDPVFPIQSYDVGAGLAAADPAFCRKPSPGVWEFHCRLS
jgi:hypothetical protein